MIRDLMELSKQVTNGNKMTPHVMGRQVRGNAQYITLFPTASFYSAP